MIYSIYDKRHRALMILLFLLSPLFLIAATKDSVDVSRFVAFYDYTVRTQNSDGKDVTDSIRLAVQVGQNFSMCTSIYSYLTYKGQDERVGGHKQYIFQTMNFPFRILTDWSQGKLTTWDYLLPNEYITEEPIDSMKWEILSDSTATTTFYGVTWNVRYADSIPSSSGPWKLHGLPGLITDAWSQDSIHHFSFLQMKPEEVTIYVESSSDIIPIKPHKFIKFRNQILCDKRYPKEPCYYTPKVNGGLISGGIAIFPQAKANVFQPLEK